MLKIAFGMIVFEGDYVLRECLEQVYPFATQILIAEGPVKYWQDKGRKSSTDKTNEILHSFPDPENKIKIIHGQFAEKDQQCNAYLQFMRDDIDYLWNLDSDEVYTTENLKKIIQFLEKEKPTSVGIRSRSFYGGFDDYLTGFELNTDNFLRIFRIVPGSTWLTHRPPTIKYPQAANIVKKHINSDELYNKIGVEMHHYSYVFPMQVFNKIQYYKAKVSMNNCIDDYFNKVYFPWVIGEDSQKCVIEKIFSGVHEFKPEFRGPCFTSKNTSPHPEAIQKNIKHLKTRFTNELNWFLENLSG